MYGAHEPGIKVARVDRNMWFGYDTPPLLFFQGIKIAVPDSILELKKEVDIKHRKLENRIKLKNKETSLKNQNEQAEIAKKIIALL